MDWDEYIKQRGIAAYMRARYGVGAYEFEGPDTFSQCDDVPLVSEEEKQEALDVVYSYTEACPMCGVVHPV